MSSGAGGPLDDRMHMRSALHLGHFLLTQLLMPALLAEMRQTNAELRTANDDLRADRDRWAAYASRPWWRRLAG